MLRRVWYCEVVRPAHRPDSKLLGEGTIPGYAWELEASGRNLADSAAGGFDLYNLVRDGKVIASVAVDADMTVLLAP